MNASTPLESAERAVARLEAASAEHPLEFLDDLAWALLYLGNERHRLGDLGGAVAADERAVARVRTLAELGGTGLNQTPSQGGRDIVYLLSSLSYRYLAAGRARDAQLAALGGYEWQGAQVGAGGAGVTRSHLGSQGRQPQGFGALPPLAAPRPGPYDGVGNPQERLGRRGEVHVLDGMQAARGMEDVADHPQIMRHPVLVALQHDPLDASVQRPRDDYAKGVGALIVGPPPGRTLDDQVVQVEARNCGEGPASIRVVLLHKVKTPRSRRELTPHPCTRAAEVAHVYQNRRETKAAMKGLVDEEGSRHGRSIPVRARL